MLIRILPRVGDQERQKWNVFNRDESTHLKL